MRFVVDANVLFSFFREGSGTRRLILNFESLELLTPGFCIDELNKYKGLICKRANLSNKGFKDTLRDLGIFVKVLSLNEYAEFTGESKEISPDPDDVDFFALALKLNCPLWSEDKELRRQSRVKVLSTKELLKLLG